MMHINDICKKAHDNAVAHGFYSPPPSVEQRLCLIHSEVSEALEAYRSNEMITRIDPATKKPEGLPSELADIIIRVCDFAEFLDVNLEHEVRMKMEYNASRPYKHNREF